jgi:hypothetical protein
MKTIFFISLCLWSSVVARAAAETNSTSASAGLELKTKTCFQCRGVGDLKCPAPKCRDGKVDCPNPCLKLTVGVWEKKTVAGHTDPNERWQRVRFGKKSAEWSSAHIGQVPTLSPDGKFSSPTCPVCQGETRITCPKCQGKTTIACAVCAGTKVVPPTWSAFDHPKMKDRPKKFTLADGRVIIGRRVLGYGDPITIRTETGEVAVPKREIIKEEVQPTDPK